MLSTLILASLLAPPKEILLVLNKAEDTVSLHDTETNEVIKTIPTGHGPNEVMVSPGGRSPAPVTRSFALMSLSAIGGAVST